MSAEPPQFDPASGALRPGRRVHDQVVEAWLRAVPDGNWYRVSDARTGRPALMHEYLPPHWAARDTDGGVMALPGRGREFQLGLRRFIARSRQLACLSHPSLFTVLDAWPSHGTACLLTPLHSGHTLADVVNQRGGRVSLSRVWPWLDQCLALAEWLHAQDKFHGAWDPAGICLSEDGESLLMPMPEFEGIAMPSTPWMALEQTSLAPSGVQRGPWTDVYGMAALTAFLLTGQSPVTARRRPTSWPASTLQPVAPGQPAPKAEPLPRALMAALRVSVLPNARQRPQDVRQFKAMMGLFGTPGDPGSTIDVPAIEVIATPRGASADPSEPRPDAVSAVGAPQVPTPADASMPAGWAELPTRPLPLDEMRSSTAARPMPQPAIQRESPLADQPLPPPAVARPDRAAEPPQPVLSASDSSQRGSWWPYGLAAGVVLVMGALVLLQGGQADQAARGADQALTPGAATQAATTPDPLERMLRESPPAAGPSASARSSSGTVPRAANVPTPPATAPTPTPATATVPAQREPAQGGRPASADQPPSVPAAAAQAPQALVQRSPSSTSSTSAAGQKASPAAQPPVRAQTVRNTLPACSQLLVEQSLGNANTPVQPGTTCR
jgi:serine/threonine protein kinase